MWCGGGGGHGLLTCLYLCMTCSPVALLPLSLPSTYACSHRKSIQLTELDENGIDMTIGA